MRTVSVRDDARVCFCVLQVNGDSTCQSVELAEDRLLELIKKGLEFEVLHKPRLTRRQTSLLKNISYPNTGLSDAARAMRIRYNSVCNLMSDIYKRLGITPEPNRDNKKMAVDKARKLGLI